MKRNTLISGLLVAFVAVLVSLAYAQGQQPQPRGDRLRSDQISTRHIVNGAITDDKMGLAIHAISIAGAATAATSTIDTASVGGSILGYYPTGNQDQLVDNIVLNANGSVTLTLAAAATATNTFNVVVARGVGVNR